MEFLGHMVDPTGIRPLAKKVNAILHYRQLASARDVQRYLGMVNFYHRFIPPLSVLARPLHAFLRKGASFVWSVECKKAMGKINEALAKRTVLHHHVPEAKLALSTDASAEGAGAVLEQWVQSVWQLLAFFSKAFTELQKRYSAFDRELLAVKLALRHFSWLLEGRVFTIYTDHNRGAEPVVVDSFPAQGVCLHLRVFGQAGASRRAGQRLMPYRVLLCTRWLWTSREGSWQQRKRRTRMSSCCRLRAPH